MMLEGTKTRILVLDDHALFREALVRLLDSEPDLTVVGHCASLQETIRFLDATGVDLVLLDFDLGLQRGFEFLSLAEANDFRGRILVVTAGLSNRDATRLLGLGVAGIFLKHHPPSSLIDAIRKVMKGECWLDSRHIATMAAAQISSSKGLTAPELTERERAVLRGVLEGLANKQIADQLRISEASVKLALQQLFRKTAVRTRGQLVRIALEEYADQL